MISRNYSDTTLSIVVFVAAAFWGMYWFPLHKIQEAGVEGTWSIVLFNLCPLVALLPAVVWYRKLFAQHIGPAVIIAIFTGLGFVLYATGLVASTVVRATLLFYLTPIWSTLIGMLWLGERLTWGRIVGIGLGLTGLALLLYKTNASAHPLNIGDLCAFISGWVWAIGAAMMKRWPDTPTVTVITYQFVIISAGAAILSLTLFDLALPQADAVINALPVALIASLFILLPTGVAIMWIAKRLFPGRIGVLMMSEVLVAILSAAILLPEERLSGIQWLGAAAIVTAALVEVILGSRDEAQDAVVSPNA